MYFLIVVCLFLIWGFFRRMHAVKKVRNMDASDKRKVLNEVLSPFGFAYLPEQDIITSTLDAWQREFGYCTFFDEAAPHLNMVFDCEPVYFDYDDRTWLIEFWKGQYGINTGGEIGVYQADSLIQPWRRWDTVFHSVKNSEMPELIMELHKGERKLFHTEQKHWWLTGFCVGRHSEPDRLVMKSAVTFPNKEMLCCFLKGLLELGYDEGDLRVIDETVYWIFDSPHSRQPCCFTPSLLSRIQWKNKIFCRIFLIAVKPFKDTADRMLYLYFFLPPVFRRLLKFRRNGRHKIPGKRKRR